MIGAIAALAMAAAAPATTPPRLPPVERCSDDAAFDQFRSRLETAVADKDVGALRDLVAPDIRINFGGDGGWHDFAAMWGLETPDDSGLWDMLRDTMAMGCAPTEAGGRVFPGLFADLGDDIDPFELLVIKPGIDLRSTPKDDAAAVSTMDWTVALRSESEPPEGWVEVRVPNGPTGFVPTTAAVSPIGYRMVVEKRDGRWLIAALVAGD